MGKNVIMKRLRAEFEPQVREWREGKAMGYPTCDLCNVVFKRERKLKTHVRRSHARALRLSREVDDMICLVERRGS
jgi:uncharacterized C2H2 Zn-finger protein